jgi:hypothetical protein
MSNPEACAVIMVPGRGIDVDGVASADTLARADAAYQYYDKHGNEVERIVLSGAYSSAMPNPPADAWTEAERMYDYLAERKVPKGIMRIEDASTDTFENFINSIERGHLQRAEFSTARQLGIVAGRAHFRRCREIGQAGLVAQSGAFRHIDVPSERSLFDTVQEAGAFMLTRYVLRGIVPGNLEQLEAARSKFHQKVDFVRGLRHGQIVLPNVDQARETGV